MAGNIDNGFVAHLHRLAGARSLKALNQQVRLKNLLTGTTCAPISLEDFELYLAYRELSIENLQFVVWFHDYQLRFSKLPLELQRMSPDPLLHTANLNTPLSPDFPVEVPTISSLPKLYSPASSSTQGSIAEKRARSKPPQLNLVNGRFPSSSSVISPGSDTHSLTPMIPSPLIALSPFQEKLASSSKSPSSFSFKSTPMTPPSAYPPSPSASTSSQPFRDETLQIVATFMRPGLSKKELPLDESLREKVLTNLAWTTHPNVFLPIYKIVYDQLELSVHQFLTISSANINRPKQLYWYGAGAVFLTIAMVIAALTTHLIPAYTPLTSITLPQTSPIPKFRSLPWKRAYRLISVPFSAIGSMQAYSAWRGFCSEVFGRSSTQLKAWELTDPKEVGVKWRRRRKRKGEKEVSEPNQVESANGVGGDHPAGTGLDTDLASTPVNDRWLIAPFADGSVTSEATSTQSPSSSQALTSPPADLKNTISPKGPVFSPTQLSGVHPLMTTHEVAFVAPRPRGGGHGGYKRPPVFGPERVVLDERIRKFHQSVLDDMAFFGLCWTIVWTAVVVSLPGPKPPLG